LRWPQRQTGVSGWINFEVAPKTDWGLRMDQL
jgi:hypothetical protein